MIIRKLAINFPAAVWGVISPKPTVVTVIMAQYMDSGILLNPLDSPSTMYMTAPTMVTTKSMVKIKIVILGRLASRAFF